jgi:hypothetical protein
MADGGPVLYRVGPCHASICAPAESTPEQIAGAADVQHPTGLSHGWSLSDDVTFATGEPNPCVCEIDTGRRHYLLVC